LSLLVCYILGQSLNQPKSKGTMATVLPGFFYYERRPLFFNKLNIMKNSITRISRISALKLFLLAGLLLTVSTDLLATATVDTTFGTNGRVLTTLGESQRFGGVAIQNNDKIVVVGNALNSATQRDGVVVRYNPNGTLDQSFGSGGKVVLPVTPRDDSFYAVAVQADGKIVVVGNVSAAAGSPNTDFLIVRVNENGSLDSTFGSNGVITINQGSFDSFRAVKIQPDGKIVAVGGTSDESGRGAVIRLNQNGSFDTSFSGGLVFIDRPLATNELFTSLDFYSNGRILIGGESVSGGERNGFVTLLEPNGALVQSFGGNGFAGRLIFTGFAQVKVKVLPNGKFIAGGDQVQVYTSNGSADNPGISRSGASFALLSNGNLAMTFQALSYSNYDTGGIRVYNKNLQLVGGDEKYGTASGSPFTGTDIIVQSNDKIIIFNGGLLRLNGVTSDGTRQAYFDDDRKTDIAVYRPSNYTFYVTRSAFSQEPFAAAAPVAEQRQIIPEKYAESYQLNNTPVSQLGWFNYATNETPGLFGIRNQPLFYWGQSGDIPVGGDYDGDGLTDYTVFRPSNGVWYISHSSNNQFRAVQFGQAGDKLVPADYDYDGITDVAVFRPANGTWYILRSSDNGFRAVQFGANGDVPAAGDYDGDGYADFVVFRPSNGVWYMLKSQEGFSAIPFGIATDQPVPGDYDGDGRHDAAVFRDGFWHINQSRDGLKTIQWGLPGDIPISVRY
jgi:uncharacterized delta-60 repeat protein